jgi:hypothetical protein
MPFLYRVSRRLKSRQYSLTSHRLYFAYLQRPLQAWSYINTTAARCQLLLSNSQGDLLTDSECIRRIFWSCYILERYVRGVDLKDCGFANRLQ